ncbi:hypothetical protein ACFL04_03015 [Patescibacteria group bacterium]
MVPSKVPKHAIIMAIDETKANFKRKNTAKRKTRRTTIIRA